jgi:D-3-phosphoglycerate dehydrogenase / 2-oxoglutarate reductase
VATSTVMGATRRLVLTTPNAEVIRTELEGLPGIAVAANYELSLTKDPRTLASGLDGVWAVIAGSEPYTRAVLANTPQLRAILRWGTGSDAIDLDAATDAGVAVVTTPGVNAEAVADMALALMLACVRRLPDLDRAVRAGRWRLPTATGDLAGATVGVVGLGSIGRAVTRRLRGFDCRVLALEPQPDPDFCARYQVELTGLDAMLPQVDVLSLHVPLSPSTHGLIGAERLARVPRHAVLINTARGELIDQAALAAALTEGRIAGAGLDVFEHEPPAPDDPILSAPNIILSGHIASFTRLGLRRTGDAVLANLRELGEGRLPAGTRNPQAWRSQPAGV